MIAAIGKLSGDGGWLRRDIAVTCMTVVAGILTLAAAIAWLAPPHLEARLAIADISADGGFAYIAPISRRAPPGYVIVGDGTGKGVSNLQLRENGQSLGPAHAGHSDIRESGKGRYSHWRTRLWFSASDSTDPRTNGRTYSISARASLHPFVLPAVALFDLLVLIAARRRLISDTRFRRDIGRQSRCLPHWCWRRSLPPACSAASTGLPAAPKDVALVVATLLHALFGCLILIAQWTAGAGLARLVLGAKHATVPNVLLLGFALSLPLVAVFAVLALSLPYGFGLGDGGLGPVLPAVARMAAGCRRTGWRCAGRARGPAVRDRVRLLDGFALARADRNAGRFAIGRSDLLLHQHRFVFEAALSLSQPRL